MAQHRQASGQFKEEHDPHHSHQHQGQAASHLQQHSRPSSIVHQQHHQQSAQSQPQHSTYSSSHSISTAYQHHASTTNTAAQAQDLPYYQQQQANAYNTPTTASGYTSADSSDMMAAAMPRPTYPPMAPYGHTPQSNSPASIASPSSHDQQRSMYGQPASALPQHSMYYGAGQYQSMAPQTQQSYPQHSQQTHQSMASQPNMMMSHTAPQQQINHHTQQHAAHQHAQRAMANSPRHPTKIEAQNLAPQMRMSDQASLVATQQQRQKPTPQNGVQHNASAAAAAAAGTNPSSAAPGPIPATTPLVVRQDGNGVQWIAFEYSRDRVKMEYTIRCDVESVQTDELSAEFRQENCVYPRACCVKELYRGNRLQYETECNTVGWALAQLNPPLRGKRGLIQRAVDSWRNSNQDLRLRSRRVRRMAKVGHRKVTGPINPNPAFPPNLGSGGSVSGPGKPGMNSMGGGHHGAHGGSAQSGGDEVGEGDSPYMEDGPSSSSHHPHHQDPSGDDSRPAQVFNSQYGHYNQNAPASASCSMSIHDALSTPAVVHRSLSRPADEPENLFPNLPEGKRRKFILVDDSDRGSRLRVRVTLSNVDTREIPDSFRKSSSVYPRSYFPREMQSPPPSATGSRFFEDADDNAHGNGSGDDGNADTEGRREGRVSKARGRIMVKVPIADGSEAEVAVPRMRKGNRGKEIRLNDLAYRMAWLQSRVFAGRTVFLQRALDCYRNKTCATVENLMMDIRFAAPHYETRVGKRKWIERQRQRAQDES